MEVPSGKMFSGMPAPSAQEIDAIGIILQSAPDAQGKDRFRPGFPGEETSVLRLSYEPGNLSDER